MVTLINQYRKVQKLKSGFVDSILGLQEEGMVHPVFNQVGTVTGRMSSSEPNMQQLPKREDKTIRRAFIAPPGFMVVTFDNSQIELRVLAYESGDPVMNEILKGGGDIHTETALRIFGKVDDFLRRLAKTINFGVVFGISPKGLAKKINVEGGKTGRTVTEDEAREFIRAYFKTFAMVERYILGLHELVISKGFVETWMGRRRYIPKVHMPAHRSAALREAQNSPIQGGASEVIKLQMIAVTEAALPFAQVHDELVFYLPAKSYARKAMEIAKLMEGIDCPFNLKVEAKAGLNFGDVESL